MHENLYEELAQNRKRIKAMGGEKAVAKQHKDGKLTARERIEYFFDPGTFTEIGMYLKHRATHFGLEGKEIPAEGVICGYGKVNGRMVMVGAEDFTSMAGTFGEYHGKKFAAAIEMAKDMGIPFVGMNDSGGARLQEGIDTLQAYAWLFKSQNLASGIIPQIATLMGPCMGGQAYHPVMQDFVFQCRNTGFMGIAGPPFVKTQLGIDIDLPTLSGWQAHAVKSGCTHVVVEDDKDCMDKVKDLLTFLPQNNKEKSARIACDDDPMRLAPELDEVMPENRNMPYDMHKVIYNIVDNGYFFEIHEEFAKNVIVGFGRFNGRATGIVASQPNWMGGVINCDAADKVARFVRFCDLFNIPLVNIHDTPAFMIGPEEDWKGILRHGAKMLYAYIDATVPKVTIIMGKSFAGAYLGMCCKDTGADIVFSWPQATVTIVGAETAASVIFAKEIKNSENPKETAAQKIKEYKDLYQNPYSAASRGYIDDVIMPNETRRNICLALDMLENKTVARPYRKYSNINL
ncbi:acyl-CoA carboxylase subunit beta [Pelotomaculum terephthalicicum JT]|uniref:acyl-CoA carboxylase subunit beta n=1 Tax=Pelotomaculum TaxID=191373 RepID=UPI0009CBDB6C|nr:MULTISPECIES: carboxyl transferase domain-containing protein [Pelotomaculum]MCG9966514.1 acyl-CoA carboxylase subunit beta [Pelotomaculum terephthalicicum JT]OPX91084.1 MAG: Methylmalonyl-CoA carboxyltransferase 12S subunit [Pelotomaculum sp. PtaB.Bin117]OPY62797.1 MAG: Methylmalonyl-CoA carboxyltransferase 12S subunit [Pelotomaculum sp. PtaU1.Bin065]